MNMILNSKTFLRDHFLLMLGVCLSVYFSYHAIAGQRSVARLVSVNAQVEQIERDLMLVQSNRGELEQRVSLLRPESLSLDYLEELAIRDIGYARDSDVTLVSGAR
jgi:cell division protein FtsB